MDLHGHLLQSYMFLSWKKYKNKSNADLCEIWNNKAEFLLSYKKYNGTI